MQNLHKSAEEYAILLKEIRMIPSTEVKENRFNDSESGAPCKGKCDSGACKSLV